jgi:phosphate uptake regulator
MSVSKNLERVGDLATNIGEEAIYIAEGEVIKHNLQPNRGAEAAPKG